MYIEYKADNSAGKFMIEELSECPRCHKSIKPEVLYSYFHHSNFLDCLDVHMLCPACSNTIFASYSLTRDTFTYYSAGLSYVSPARPKNYDWGEIISYTSPDFVEIYNQSAAAETYGLHQIAGVGYRKALEFLIKDYLISQTFDPDKIAAIKSKFLGKCINEDIENPQLQKVAARAAWLGNDQTHYEQRYDDRDINDLKRMIRLTVHWISLLAETEEAEAIERR